MDEDTQRQTLRVQSCAEKPCKRNLTSRASAETLNMELIRHLIKKGKGNRLFCARVRRPPFLAEDTGGSQG